MSTQQLLEGVPWLRIPSIEVMADSKYSRASTKRGASVPLRLTSLLRGLGRLGGLLRLTALLGGLAKRHKAVLNSLLQAWKRVIVSWKVGKRGIVSWK